MQNKSFALKAGTQLQNGRYVISRVLGQGGFGITYEATLTSLDKRVAIKEYFLGGFCSRDEDGHTIVVPIKANQEFFERQRKRFHDEADRLAHLNNAHLVSVHDLFEENGTSYYVMDFIEGKSLSNKIEHSTTPFAEKEVMAILDQMLDALNCIHSQDPPLCHLDIKPANIMMDDIGHAVLIDFGASKYATAGEGSASLSSVIYTPSFAPVEQLSGNKKSMGPWTDFYSLGATLYTLLTFKKPAEPSDILVDKTPYKSQSLPLPTSVSPRLRQLILWMMSFDKSDRPQSVNEIRRWLDSGTPASTHDGERTVVDGNDHYDNYDRPEKRKNTLLIFIASLLAVALLAAVGYIFLNKPSKTDADQNPIEVTNVNEDKEPMKEEEKVEKVEKVEEVSTVTEPELQTVQMSMWGYAGETNFNFDMNGTTGSYIPYDFAQGKEHGARRQLKLVSYNPKNGRCIINAYLKGKYIGQFDGIFKEEEIGEHFLQSYQGKFISVNGAKLDFQFHYD